MHSFIDLFCGIGGFRIALQKQGMECVFSSDIDKNVREQYKKNFGEKPHGDITEIPERKIPKHDILCAGFPCQSFSISGNQLGLKDNRGRLFYEIVRIAEYHRPCILLLENVKNIVSIDGGRLLQSMVKRLDSIGYDIKYDILNASYFGIPQARERIYFVGIRRDIGIDYKIKYNTPKTLMKNIYLDDILENEVDEKLYVNRKDIQINKEKVDNELKPIRLGIINKGGQGERIYSIKGHAITLSAYGGGVGARTGLYLTEKGIRKLSLTECKKLMGFSKNYHVSNGMEGYKQLGNSIIPPMIEHIYNNIKVV